MKNFGVLLAVREAKRFIEVLRKDRDAIDPTTFKNIHLITGYDGGIAAMETYIELLAARNLTTNGEDNVSETRE